MEEVEATIYDGDRVVMPGTSILLDVPEGSTEASGWHAHASLPLSTVIAPGERMRIETTDGRSGTVDLIDEPVIEGDRVVYVFTGTGPLGKAGA
jgi:hypothetical protein